MKMKNWQNKPNEKKLRMKGWSKRTVDLILIVLVVIVAATFLFVWLPQFFPQVFGSILILTGEYEKPVAVKLEAAIKCSYYSCAKGCDASEINELTILVGGQERNCRDICLDKATNGKMCGEDNAIKAAITEAKGELLQKQDMPFVRCLGEIENCGGPVGFRDFIFFQKGVLKENTQENENCPLGPRSYPGFKRTVVESGTYNVWTSEANIVGGLVINVCK